LLWYAAGLIGHCLVEIISRAFYALHDTKTPVLVGIGAMTLNLLFSLLFTALFRQIGWMPHGGLALANSLATALESILLVILMRKRLQGLEGSHIFNLVLKALIASSAMGAAIWLWLAKMPNLPVWQSTLGAVVLGVAVFAASILLLRVEEIGSVWELLRKKFIQNR